jgi:holo-[acyl-carrier protein] synthase
LILGIGCDIVDVDRIKKAHKKMGWTFVHRILGPNELEVFSGLEGGQEVIYLARRFAAKEAFAKAWGTGMTTQLDWRDVQVLNEANGRPILSFCKDLREAVYSTRRHFNVTISDNDDNVIAFVTMEAA